MMSNKIFGQFCVELCFGRYIKISVAYDCFMFRWNIAGLFISMCVKQNELVYFLSMLYVISFFPSRSES